MLVPTCAVCHQILMLLLTYLWNASPSVCEETSQDLPSQLLPRRVVFAVHWELSSAEALSTTVPRGIHSIPHTFPAPGTQGLGPGEAEMNQTRSLPTRSPQSAGGGNIHINYMGPGWVGTHAGIQRGGLGLERGRELCCQSQG